MKTISLTYEGYYREEHFSSIPSFSGVYSFFECQFNPYNDTVTLSRLLYIGQAIDCRERIMGHDKIVEMKKGLRYGSQLCVHVANVTEPDKSRAENALIYQHKPPYNDLLKNSFDYDTTTIVNSRHYDLLQQQFTVSRTHQFGFKRF